MSEYKRLTWINEEGVALPINGTKYQLDDDTEKCLNRLAELEDKIESGQLIELPCNQVFFIVDKHKPQYAFVCGKGIAHLKLYEILDLEKYGYYRTYEQAEARLKELKGE